MSLETRIKAIADMFPKGDSCWPWPRYRDKDGYGMLKDDNGKTIRAHQASHIVFKGELKGLHVLHSCDNPPCFNPKHLSLGTNHENILDCIKKGRHYTFGRLQKGVKC